jgi:geranylgeranyl pyrophosphate synthase
VDPIFSFLDPVKEELAETESVLMASGQSDHPWINELLDYILMTSGKRARPAITLLSGKLFEYNKNLHIPMAVAVELLHTASLVHDDTVDQSKMRRNSETINAKYGDNVAILFGDYLFATAAEIVCETENVQVIRIFSQTLRMLADGELREIDQAFDPSSGLPGYWARVERKTSSLFSTSAECGAILGNASAADIQNMKLYGTMVGTAFQIIDDILDFEAEEKELGKPLGQDLKQGILTLPVLLYLQNHPENDHLVRSLKTTNEVEKESSLSHILDLIKSEGCIEQSYEVAQDYASRALQAIKTTGNLVPRDSLEQIVEFIISRKR